MDTYLAAFLACWLCAFVLPLRDLGCIRPSVFKPASELASGRRISLAIPVLTCIYKGLSELSSSFTPIKQVEHFPAHYVYAWLA
ncbi:Late secretory pathway protein avl9 [Bienertia sinuspersici]